MDPAPAYRLDSITLLRGLTGEDCRAIASQCAWRRCAAGTLVIARDSASRDVLFIVDGRVRVVDTTGRGREVVYAEIAAGGQVGELAAIDGGPRSADVVAVTDCLVAALPAGSFRTLLARHPEVALRALERFARIVRLADRRITELSTLPALERICRELLRLARQQNGALVVDELPTQELIASITGTTRETVGKVMAQLAHSGLVRRRHQALHLLDIESIKTLADVTELATDAHRAEISGPARQ